MATRARPATLTLRVTLVDQARAVTLAQSEGLSTSEFLHRLLVPALRDRASGLETEPGDGKSTYHPDPLPADQTEVLKHVRGEPTTRVVADPPPPNRAEGLKAEAARVMARAMGAENAK